MTRYLITSSLYSAWSWYRRAEDDGEARRDLIAYLKREPIAPNERMIKGRKLEADIQAAAEGAPMLPLADPEYEAVVDTIAGIVKGGLWQERCYQDIHFPRHGDFLLYGKMDVIHGPWIFDIKYVENYEIGKYNKSVQHQIYMTAAGLPHFAYLTSNGKVYYREDYHYSPDHYREMRSRLSEMLDDFKRDKELADLYEKYWRADRERA